MRKKGFTLVELSIVLVIIGLLISGILVGQSLIESAKIQGVIRQLSQYDVAIATFKTKYNGLPADESGIGTCNPAGETCNNGIVAEGSGYGAGYVWEALSLGVGLKNHKGQNFGTWDTFSTTTPDNCPRFDIDQDLTGLPCLLVSWSAWANGVGTYQYRQSSGASVASTYDALKPVDVLALDTKLDDGLAVNKVPRGVLGQTMGSSTSTTCSTGTAYNVTNNNYACSMWIEIGLSTGVNN